MNLEWEDEHEEEEFNYGFNVLYKLNLVPKKEI